MGPSYMRLTKTQTINQNRRKIDMAAFDTTRVQFETASLASRIGQVFATLVATLIAWNDARVTRGALSALSDRELEDIGLSRSDIENIG